MKLKSLFLFLLPVAAGAGLAVWFASQATPPARVQEAERSVSAHIFTAEASVVHPVVTAYGNARPARTWQAIAQVAGAVVWRHPDLDTGNFIPAGTTVLRIDPTAYDLALAQAEADMAALEVDMAQLQVDKANTQALLTLEADRQALANSDLQRMRDLVQRGAAPQVRLDEQERATLLIRRGVIELRNSLSLFPSTHNRLLAQKAKLEVAMNRARRDLSHVEITTPFTLRVSQIHAELHQFVGVGQALVSADDISEVEITAHIPVTDFRRMLFGSGGHRPASLLALQDRLGDISVDLRLAAGGSLGWTGRLVRIESALGPQARSVPAVVSVRNTYFDAEQASQPPIIPNMYLELTLRGTPQAGVIVIPDGAVRNGVVYLRNAEGRLEQRPVTVAWRQQDQAVISQGLSVGDAVILDDLALALPGLLITPVQVAQ